ncbi:MAG: hypothetical protein QXM92_00505 [Candidatus Anstonellales archaeon]
MSKEKVVAKSTKHTIAIYLTDDLINNLRSIADYCDCSVSKAVQLLLEEHIDTCLPIKLTLNKNNRSS